VGQPCVHTTDCAAGLVCSGPTDASPGGLCEDPGCADGIKDGQETDVDCGGPVCAHCADGKACVSNNDCVDQACGVDCAAGTCCPASCTDGIKNGVETDTDCGGNGVGTTDNCPRCLVGKACQQGSDCDTNLCNTNSCACPGTMVTMPTVIVQNGAYCIDATEVTNAQYDQFWLANPTSGIPSECQYKVADGGNGVYTPLGGAWPPTLGCVNGSTAGNPVVGVDWCDAYMYCQWAGKRLCGHIGDNPDAGDPNSNPTTAFGDTRQSAWYNACSAEHANIYPYGVTFNATDCNGAGGAGTIVADTDCTGNPQGGLTTCQGGAPGLYQMSGNVAEWEDSCDNYVGPTDNCYLRGGSFQSQAGDLACTPLDGGPPPTGQRSSFGNDIGFRCCL
jgi:sulfatase-modifying factor enzyme 1